MEESGSEGLDERLKERQESFLKVSHFPVWFSSDLQVIQAKKCAFTALRIFSQISRDIEMLEPLLVLEPRTQLSEEGARAEIKATVLLKNLF